MPMKILPPVTHPPKQPFIRQHQPRLIDHEKGYHTFVPCLRWEFGFTCAFCLLHEGDLAEFGIEINMRQFSVEHRELQKDDANRPDKQANLYSNCLYACMLCNRARSTKPLYGDNNVKLLDPTVDAWADHFEAYNDRLIPKTPEAIHTDSVYRLDDRRKNKLRRTRRERIEEGMGELLNGPSRITRLRKLAEELASSDDAAIRAKADILLQEAQRQSEYIRKLRKALERYQCIPEDARAVPKCRCNHAKLCIPAAFEEHSIDV